VVALVARPLARAFVARPAVLGTAAAPVLVRRDDAARVVPVVRAAAFRVPAAFARGDFVRTAFARGVFVRGVRVDDAVVARVARERLGGVSAVSGRLWRRPRTRPAFTSAFHARSTADRFTVPLRKKGLRSPGGAPTTRS
jgi:hypothetical protein